MKYCEQAPKPAVLLAAIRAIGYSFETAVADIVDNSISAMAKNIRIFSEPSGEPYFAFLDDGIGMTQSELRNALLLGSDRSGKSDAPMELGRFGLGLKSASFSQCRHFCVVTKQGADINAMSFCLDDVERSGTWRTAILDEAEWETVPEVGRLMQYEHGTLVVWRDFDRLRINTANFETSFRRIVKMAKCHVEYVFHRFYGDVVICFNEERVEKRDPFLLDSYGMQQEGRGVSVEVDGHKIRITPYSLPYANALTAEERRLLGNPKSIYDEQGLYLYRNRRLIAWGSWFRTEVRSELNKLARVKVDIPSSLDEIWMLDVKKSSAKIPDKIRDSIRIAVGDSVSRSRGAVSKPSERETMAEHKVWIRELRSDNSVEYTINRDNPTYKALRATLAGGDLTLFEQFVSDLQDYLPKHQIHIDQAGDVNISNGEALEANIGAKMADLIRKLKIVEDESDRQHILDRYLSFENYRCLKPHKATILEEARHDG
ncbi:MAG: ATP-binding protein [Kiritimatiellia bacterium]